MSKALIIIDMWDKHHSGQDRLTSPLEQLSLRLKSRMHKISLINIPIVVASYNTPMEKKRGVTLSGAAKAILSEGR